MTSQASSTPSLAQQLHCMLHPTEGDRYKAYFKEELWSLEEFSSLMAGTIPNGFVGKKIFVNQAIRPSS